jgi:hypothetical protein
MGTAREALKIFDAQRGYDLSHPIGSKIEEHKAIGRLNRSCS